MEMDNKDMVLERLSQTLIKIIDDIENGKDNGKSS